jgi:hypothetical protein
MESQGLIPDHQFGFRGRHANIEQIHKIVKKINNEMKTAKYCIAVFLDVLQIFDEFWHQRLLHKIKNSFPTDLYAIIRFYLLHRTFRINYGEVITQLKEINSGVPQGSVLGPVLFLLCTADLLVFLSNLYR